MSTDDMQFDYQVWLCGFVYGNADTRFGSYHLLMDALFELPFEYSRPMDENRWVDGVQLRYRYGDEKDIPSAVIAKELDTRPCSMLELMVALSLRCEETIMTDTRYGDRTGQWFWNMVHTLGLNDFPDQKFDRYRVDRIVERFNNRQYQRNGRGGLFETSDGSIDMRSMDIWYQMHAYLNETDNQ